MLNSKMKRGQIIYNYMQCASGYKHVWQQHSVYGRQMKSKLLKFLQLTPQFTLDTGGFPSVSISFQLVNNRCVTYIHITLLAIV